MGWSSFFKRKPSEPTARTTPAADAGDPVQQARTRARQRLIGAAMLVIAGVVVFPLLFETKPRALPSQTPIDIVGRQVAPTSGPALKAPAKVNASDAPRGVVIHETAADAGVAVEPAVPTATSAVDVLSAKPARDAPSDKPAEKSSDKFTESSAEKPAVKGPEKPTAKSPEQPPEKAPAEKPSTDRQNDARRAQAALDGKEAAKKPDAKEGRFVVQVGAFADTASARDMRQRVEKLGLKTFTQVIDTAAGSRIRVRVGPFATKAEAERAAAKLKSAGLSPATYSL